MHIASWETVSAPGVGGTGGNATRDSVVDAFPRVQSQWEGSAKQFNFLYTDATGLVTTGMGNLMEDRTPGTTTPWVPALKYPWVHKSDGTPASQAEIIQDWQTVKAAHTATGSYDAANDAKITQLKLPDLVLQDISATQLVTNEKELLKSLPGFASFPADAQMAIHGMAWAMGSGFIPVYGFKAFQAAANAQDWAAAKANSAFKGAAPQRKAGHDRMFDNAVKAKANRLNYDTLWYPQVAPAAAPSGIVVALKKPAVLVAAALGLVAIGGGIYVATRPVAGPRRGESHA